MADLGAMRVEEKLASAASESAPATIGDSAHGGGSENESEHGHCDSDSEENKESSDNDEDAESTDSSLKSESEELTPLPPHIEVPLEIQINILMQERSHEYVWERRIGM
jgi:hypothetical protein